MYSVQEVCRRVELIATLVTAHRVHSKCRYQACMLLLRAILGQHTVTLEQLTLLKVLECILLSNNE